ncbi:lytic transglycosylase domain-containing protein [Methylopila henanensis]|uniref:Lytic transglycosylase domain-containing protein n=1 Tax=Methylopila henanensis TaxID=873516 RepID=A0ABW4K955_9HYPH
MAVQRLRNAAFGVVAGLLPALAACPSFATESAAVPTSAVVAPAPEGRAAYVALVRREAAARGLPPEVAEAVAHVESGYEPSAVGAVGEIGLMQIRPETAAMLGHDGGALALFDPATNARYAVRYLAEAWRLANGDLCRALMKYRAGHRAERMSDLSVQYCRRAKSYLATLGSPLADGAAPEVAIRSLLGDVRPSKAAGGRKGPYLGWRPGRHTPADNARFWAAHEARIKALSARIDARRRLRVARGG